MLSRAPSTRWRSTGNGANRICLPGWGITVFEYRLAREVHEALAKHAVRYLFLGKSGAILLGFPDTTQDADLFPDKSPENGE